MFHASPLDFDAIRYNLSGIVSRKSATNYFMYESIDKVKLDAYSCFTNGLLFFSLEVIMSIIDLINKRYSVRAYKSDPIEEEKLLYVLDAARLAPTANNRQPFQIIMIHTKGKEQELLSIYPREWFVQAPMIICVCGLPEIAWLRRDGRQYLDVDIAIVMDHMVLAASDIGLGTCFIAAFDAVNARKVLSIPDDVEPILFTPLGYPADTPRIKVRKNLDELVRYEHW
jgi:nitroreductase